jgi:hypothetical protein
MQVFEKIRDSDGCSYDLQPPVEVEDGVAVEGLLHIVAIRMAQKTGTPATDSIVTYYKVSLESSAAASARLAGHLSKPKALAIMLSELTGYDPYISPSDRE